MPRVCTVSRTENGIAPHFRKNQTSDWWEGRVVTAWVRTQAVSVEEELTAKQLKCFLIPTPHPVTGPTVPSKGWKSEGSEDFPQSLPSQR